MVGKRWTKPPSSRRLTAPHDGVTIGIGSSAQKEFPPTIGHDLGQLPNDLQENVYWTQNEFFDLPCFEAACIDFYC